MDNEHEPDGFKIAAEQNIISARFNARVAARGQQSDSLKPFHRSMLNASRNGVLATFEAMHVTVQKAIVNWHDPSTQNGAPTALMEAAAHGHAEIVKHLLKIGADVSLVNDHGRTALISAAQSAKPEVTALLLDAGADINHSSDAGYTPLAEAVNHGNTAVVALLLERGAGIRGVLIASRSIRALAEALGRHAIVEMLDAEEKKRGGEEAAKLVEKGTAETITVSRSPLKLKPR